MAYTVRTIFLQNYFTPASKLAQQRRAEGDVRDIVSAMKQTELANQALEREINAYSERGFDIISIIPHPVDDTANHCDLLVTVILQEKA